MTKLKRQKKTKKKIVKERDCEDWCFVCKDGGELILCDYRDCLKVYHPNCVGKDDSFVETGERWTCERHSCLTCHKTPKFYCYCCPNAVCGRCIGTTEFAPVRGKKGLCDSCLELVLFVEGEEDLDTEGGNIDLKDRDTFECLFLEYWDIIKEEEGLTLDDVYSAENRIKKGQYCSKSFKSNKIGNVEEDIEPIALLSDVDSTEESEVLGKRKESKAFEFTGWGSKPLIEFLRSLGKDTTEELSQYAVDSIICEYVQEKRLFDPTKRKKIFCDEKLYSVFRKKSIHKNRIYSLLEAHLAVNVEQSEENEAGDEIDSGSSGKTEKTIITYKKQRTSMLRRKIQKIEAAPEVQESCFASIVAENIKLVYLRRSLVEELLNEPESFEGKVVGCFVKVKNDPKDYMQRNSHQLLKVTGIKKTSTTDEKNEILLRVTNITADVHISMLSDFDFFEEEIEDLRQKVEQGILPKPTVVELEQKAKHLHKDISKHWIEKELVRLQKFIDFANEKGWRRELDECLYKREMLKKPSEQERLIQLLPKVIPEMVKCNAKEVQ